MAVKRVIGYLPETAPAYGEMTVQSFLKWVAEVRGMGGRKLRDAVEGVIMLRTGDKTQDVLKRVEAKTQELNGSVLPKDVKVVPFYDRTDLVGETLATVPAGVVKLFASRATISFLIASARAFASFIIGLMLR